jgi:hypothetical protein
LRRRALHVDQTWPATSAAVDSLAYRATTTNARAPRLLDDAARDYAAHYPYVIQFPRRRAPERAGLQIEPELRRHSEIDD